MADPRIAVIAGAGEMPKLIVNALEQRGERFIVLGLKGYASEQILKHGEYISIEIEKIDFILKTLKHKLVKRVVFAGSIKRPPLTSFKLDKKAWFLLAKLGFSKLYGGDDNLMSHIVALLTREGFEVSSPEFIIPDMLAQVGNMTKRRPSSFDKQDIEMGKKVLIALGKLDIGQSVIVENGCVLGIEAAEGTDQLIQRCSKLKREGAPLGIIVKMKKLAQERRIDLPAIGTQTIQNLYDGGFQGIAIEANATLIINKKAVVSLADELKIFIVGI